MKTHITYTMHTLIYGNIYYMCIKIYTYNIFKYVFKYMCKYVAYGLLFCGIVLILVRQGQFMD